MHSRIILQQYPTVSVKQQFYILACLSRKTFLAYEHHGNKVYALKFLVGNRNK